MLQKKNKLLIRKIRDDFIFILIIATKSLCLSQFEKQNMFIFIIYIEYNLKLLRRKLIFDLGFVHK